MKLKRDLWLQMRDDFSDAEASKLRRTVVELGGKFDGWILDDDMLMEDPELLAKLEQAIKDYTEPYKP